LIIFHCKKINTFSYFTILLFLNKYHKKNEEEINKENLYKEAYTKYKNIDYSAGRLILQGKLLNHPVYLLERKKYKDIVLKALSGYYGIFFEKRKKLFYFNLSSYSNRYFHLADIFYKFGFSKLAEKIFFQGIDLIDNNLEKDLQSFLNKLIMETSNR
jgi:hypothetical protein